MTTTVASPPNSQGRLIVAQIKHNHRKSNTVRAELLDLIADFDELDLARSFGASSTASWLERELRYPTSTAYEYVSVARKLRVYRALFHFFRAGAIDYTTVRFLLRYINHENQDQLIELATTLCFAELEKALAGGDTDKDKPDAPYFNARKRKDGCLEGDFLLPPVIGEALLAALKIAQLAAEGITEGGEAFDNEAFIAELVDALSGSESSGRDTDAEEPDEDAYLDFDDGLGDTEPNGDGGDDDSWTEEVNLGPGPDIEEACPGEQTKRSSEISLRTIRGLPSRYGPPVKADMYDAFVTMINMVRTFPHPATRAPGAQVTVMLTEDGKAWMPSNPQTPSKAIESYVANAMVRGHLLDSRGLTMHFGRARRFASDGQIHALLSVWGHQCAMPGCTHSRFLEIHHIREWSEGGKTDIGNLIPLCSSCHSKVSHGIARIVENGPELEFSFLDGSRFISRNRVLPEVASFELVEHRDDPSFA